VTNAVLIKEEPIEEDIDEEEEDPAYPIVDNKEVANVPIKLEEFFDCSVKGNEGDDDGSNYWNQFLPFALTRKEN